MNKMKKHLDNISEQVDEVNNHMFDLNAEKLDGDELEHVLNRRFRDSFIKDHPKCFLPINSMTKGIRPFFPICNKEGAMDPQMVKLSIKISNKLLGNSEYDQEHLLSMQARMVLMLRKMGSGLGPI